MLDQSILRKIPLVSRLSEGELSSLRDRFKFREVRKNAVIMKEGGLGQELMIILSGSVRVYKAGNKGKEVTLAVLHAGDFFGEIALLTNSSRTAHIIALEKTTLLELSRDDFKSHLGSFSGLPLALAQSLAERLRLASGKLSDMALLDVPHRLLTTLERMSTENPNGEGRIVVDRPTHQELADMVGSSREVISRCLKSLEREGQLTVEGRNITINRNE
jgi:CRP/FNR family cyclic AMP-dependent transcriptional regulator